MWRQPKVEALILELALKRVLTPRRKPIRTDPARKHMLELQQKKWKIIQGLFLVSFHGILFLFD